MQGFDFNEREFSLLEEGLRCLLDQLISRPGRAKDLWSTNYDDASPTQIEVEDLLQLLYSKKECLILLLGGKRKEPPSP